MTTCPTQEVFEDPFPQDLEFLFLEEDAAPAKSPSEDTTTAEPINTLVKPTEWSMSVEDTRALLADIGGQLSSLGIRSQGNDQGSQAEVFGPVEASVLVKNKGVLDEGDRDISSFLQTGYRLEECAQRDYLHEVERPKTREKQCFRLNYQPYNLGGGNTGHFHQVREFNDRIQERVGQTTRIQCMQRPDDPGGISDQSRRHHWSSLGGGMVC